MSVNGKPFRPDPTSYQMTGIPCGNPKRYKSRAVIRMTRDEKIPYEDQQIGIPGSGTETEAEKELRNLLDQQMDVSLGAGEKKVNFVTSTREVMGTASGFMTLDKFLKVTEEDKKTHEYRSLGFTDLQIGMILQQEGVTTSDPIVNKKRKANDAQLNDNNKRVIGPAALSHHESEQKEQEGEGEGESSSNISDCIMPHPDYVAQSLIELRELQGKRDAELIAAANARPHMSRHRLQLEVALLQGKAHLPLAHIYVNGAKKLAQHLTSVNIPGASINDIMLPDSVEKNDKKNDSGDKSPPSSSPSSSSSSKTNGKAAENGEEKKVITGKIESIPESEIEASRKSPEEIAKQFPNYNVGTPSKILYVKNLDASITAQDLVSIFIRFQEEGKDKINFKLMDGKMKGQAFITFHDEATATKAQKLAHGYVFKNKPMIIQYGKQK